MHDRADADLLNRLLSQLAKGPASSVPTGTLGRLRRTAGAGLRLGISSLSGRMHGREDWLAALTPEAIERLVFSLGELKGVAMKMGQILSYINVSLPPESRRLLAVLQTQSQPTRFSEVRRVIQEELHERAGVLLDTLDEKPVAVASIGQVHRATLPDGTRVAVKVLHPGIEEAIRSDFGGAKVGAVLARLVAPGGEVSEVIAEAKARFLEECDYSLEAQRQTRFAEVYRNHPSVTVPVVHPLWSARRVLTTAWHEGMPFEAFLATNPSPDVRNRAGHALYEFYIGTLYRHGLFNADPHPGNILFSPDGRVTLLDYGCVREFDPETVAALIALRRAVCNDDADAIRLALKAIGMGRPGPDFPMTRMLLRGYFKPLLKAGSHVIEPDMGLDVSEITKGKLALLRMRLPGKLLFLFRIRFGLYAVLSRLGADLDWAALEEELSQ